MTENSYTPGEEVKWVMRPSDGSSGYQRGIVVKLGPRKIGIAIENLNTGKWYPKWVHPLRLRKILSPVFNGAVCIECDRWYSLAELEEIDQTGVVPCGHRWAGLFDTVPE